MLPFSHKSLLEYKEPCTEERNTCWKIRSGAWENPLQTGKKKKPRATCGHERGMGEHFRRGAAAPPCPAPPSAARAGGSTPGCPKHGSLHCEAVALLTMRLLTNVRTHVCKHFAFVSVLFRYARFPGYVSKYLTQLINYANHNVISHLFSFFFRGS